MGKNRFILLAILVGLTSVPIDSAANETGSILGNQTGKTIDSLSENLTENGYEVSQKVIKYKVDTNNPRDWFLAAQKKTDLMVSDRIYASTDLHPTNPRVAIITRDIVYAHDKGPKWQSVKSKLTSTMAEEPSFIEEKSNRITYGYRWKKGKQKKAKPFSLTADCMHLFTLLDGYERTKSQSYHEMDGRQIGSSFAKPHKGNYYEDCGQLAYVDVSFDKYTGLTTSIRMRIMDNEMISRAVEEHNEWLIGKSENYRQMIHEQSLEEPDL